MKHLGFTSGGHRADASPRRYGKLPSVHTSHWLATFVATTMMLTAGFFAMPEAAKAYTVDSSAPKVSLYDYDANTINTNHTLKFGSVGDNNTFNGYTQSSNPFSNILADKLSNGYPVLNSSTTGSSESLSYLFDASTTGVTKSYTNVGLFEKDSEGYYVYDSAKNFAEVSQSNANANVYGYPYISLDENNTQRQISGNTYNAASELAPYVPLFMPFNTLGSYSDSAYTTSASGYNQVMVNTYGGRYQRGSWGGSWGSSGTSYLAYKGYTMNESYDYSFGMTMDADFYMPKNGQVNGEAMIFDFTGDDDMWVFIDDKLVLDLGGIHDAASGTINFATGDVTVNGSVVSYLKSILGSDWQKAYETHNIRIFYFERGNGGSNCRIRFNLPTIPEGTIDFGKNLDTNTNSAYANDIEFQFKAYIDYDGSSNDKQTGYELYTGSYDIYNLSTDVKVGSGTTTDQGIITLRHNQYARISTADVSDEAKKITALSKYYITEVGATSHKYTVTLSGTTVGVDQTETKAAETNIIKVDDSAHIVFTNTVVVENMFNLEVAKDMTGGTSFDTFYALVKINGSPYKGAYTIHNTSNDLQDGDSKTTNNGVIELDVGQYAKIQGLVGGQTVTVGEVDSSGNAFTGGDNYGHPTYSMSAKAGTPFSGSISDVTQGNEISATSNEGKDLGYTSNLVPVMKATITNQKLEGSLSLTKKVSGSAANKDEHYTFSLSLKDKSGNALSGNYGVTYGDSGQDTYNCEASDGTLIHGVNITFESGAATLSLKHNEKAIISGLPAGATVIVTETGLKTSAYFSVKAKVSTKDETTVTPTGEKTTTSDVGAPIVAGSDTPVTFTNTTNLAPDVGMSTNSGPMGLLLGVGIAGALRLVVAKRKDLISRFGHGWRW